MRARAEVVDGAGRRGCLASFLVLAAFGALRPIRDELGVAAGISDLRAMMVATLAAMAACAPLVAAAARHSDRRRLPARGLGVMGASFALAGAFLLLDAERFSPPLLRPLYVWVSVTNLLGVSLFWAWMAERASTSDAARPRSGSGWGGWGRIAGAGTAGAIAGAGLTAVLVEETGTGWLVLLAGAMLLGAGALLRPGAGEAGSADGRRRPGFCWTTLSGGAWSVARSPLLLGIAAFVLLYAVTGTLVYLEQARIVAAAVEARTARAELFARIDLAGNALALLAQLVLTDRLLRRLPAGAALAFPGAVLGIGVVALAAAPTVGVLAGVQVLRRAVNYAVLRPAREGLFAAPDIEGEDRYAAKGLIDTLVYRAGDAVGAGLDAAAAGIGSAAGAGFALAALPLAATWSLLGLYLGRRAGGCPDGRHVHEPGVRPADRPAACETPGTAGARSI